MFESQVLESTSQEIFIECAMDNLLESNVLTESAVEYGKQLLEACKKEGCKRESEDDEDDSDIEAIMNDEEDDE